MSGEPTKEELKETMEVVGKQIERMIKLAILFDKSSPLISVIFFFNL